MVPWWEFFFFRRVLRNVDFHWYTVVRSVILYSQLTTKDLSKNFSRVRRPCVIEQSEKRKKDGSCTGPFIYLPSTRCFNSEWTGRSYHVFGITLVSLLVYDSCSFVFRTQGLLEYVGTTIGTCRLRRWLLAFLTPSSMMILKGLCISFNSSQDVSW